MSAPRRENHPGRAPKIEDVRAAYFSGKVTTEEANDLADSSGRFAKSSRPLFGGGVDHPHNTKNSKPSDFSLDHEARNAQKRAGLSE